MISILWRPRYRIMMSSKPTWPTDKVPGQRDLTSTPYPNITATITTTTNNPVKVSPDLWKNC